MAFVNFHVPTTLINTKETLTIERTAGVLLDDGFGNLCHLFILTPDNVRVGYFDNFNLRHCLLLCMQKDGITAAH